LGKLARKREYALFHSRAGLILTVNMTGMIVESDQERDILSAGHFKYGASHGIEIKRGAAGRRSSSPQGTDGDAWVINGVLRGMDDIIKMSSGPTRRILIVDDNPRLLRMLEMRFSESGYQATVMERVKDALITSITEKPDLIIADVMMPEISGWEFKKLLNNIPSMADIPFIFITANESLPLESYTEQFGPIDHLRKPYSFEELLAKVETNLKRKVKRDETKSVESETSRGTLEDMTLVDVMQVLAMNRKTCSVTLVKGKEIGKIYFREGRPLDAKVGNLRGDDAVYALLDWKGADFSIGEEPKTTIQVSVTKDLHALIAEGLQRIEEAEWIEPSSPSPPASQAGADEPTVRLPESEQILDLPEGYVDFPEKDDKQSKDTPSEPATLSAGQMGANGPSSNLNLPEGSSYLPEGPSYLPEGPVHHPTGRTPEDTKSFLERMKKMGLVKELST
jgi:DNA-binding response OmpR family regulator